MIKQRIAFDVDGTLIQKTINGDVPRYDVLQTLFFLESIGHTIFIWSGGGVDYAEHWARKLGVPATVRILPKTTGYEIDLAFDDQEASLATVTIRV